MALEANNFSNISEQNSSENINSKQTLIYSVQHLQSRLNKLLQQKNPLNNRQDISAESGENNADNSQKNVLFSAIVDYYSKYN